MTTKLMKPSPKNTFSLDGTISLGSWARLALTPTVRQVVRILMVALASIGAIQSRAQTLTILDSFMYGPESEVVLSGNTLYGSAEGAIFAVKTDGTGFRNLCRNGCKARLVLSGSTLYGTTEYSGDDSSTSGTVFAIHTDGSGFTILHEFAGGIGGANPVAGLLLSGDTLYGSTRAGGISDVGTIFSLNINGSGFTNLHHFSG